MVALPNCQMAIFLCGIGLHGVGRSFLSSSVSMDLHSVVINVRPIELVDSKSSSVLRLR